MWGGYARPGDPAAVHDCYYQRAVNDPGVAQLWAYTDGLSYAPGETVKVHVSTTAPSFDIHLTRDGARPRQVWTRRSCAGAFHRTPEDCSVAGCGWPVMLEIPVDPDWPSGVYLLSLTAEVPGGGALSYDHLFIIRPGGGARDERLLLVAATGTWTAYNDWGGSNHYEGITGPGGDRFSPVLSLDRPFAKGFVSLPADAPRIPLKEPPALGAPLRYPHMEWAYANGYSKKYASAGWAQYERPFLCWLEEQGFSVDVVSGQDLHFRPEILDRYACILFVGHDEYWSWEMRDAVERYTERGGNVARFAGNFLWQIRYEDRGRIQVCYKYRAAGEDPFRTSDRRHLTTTCWDAPVTGRPGAETFGLSGTRGIYAGWGGCAPRGPGGFTVYRPDHWVFEGADLYYGDVLGASSRLFGYEVDGVDLVVRDGLPYATGVDGAPDSLEIVAMGLSTVFEADHGNGGTPFIGAEDAAFLANELHGDASPQMLDRYKRGCGMIATFTRGAGCVFNAGSCEWVAGLIDRDPQVERVTRNVLARFLKKLA